MASSAVLVRWLRASLGLRLPPRWQQETSYGAGPAASPPGPCLSGAVLVSCACYSSLGFSGAYLDALGVHFLRLGYQDLQNAVLG
jgi:hypothetical protein